MKQFQILEDPTFGQVRTTMIDGNPHFVGMDVAKALGYTKTNKAIRKHVANEDVAKGCVIEISIGPGIKIKEAGATELLLINAKGVDALVSSSTHPKAKLFKEWLMSKKTSSHSEMKIQRLKAELRESIEVLPTAKHMLKLNQGFIQEVESRIAKLENELGNITDDGEDRSDTDKSNITEDIASNLHRLPEHIKLFLMAMGVLKHENGEWSVEEKYQGCSCPKCSSSKTPVS